MDTLRAEGVRHAFGIPGIHNLAIYDALLGQSEIAHVLARHEAGAGFMADGYARASGRPGVLLVTTGPGLTYEMAANPGRPGRHPMDRWPRRNLGCTGRGWRCTSN